MTLNDTVPNWLAAVSDFGGKVAIALDDRALTYADVDAQSRRLAAGLLARGVGKGTRVGILFGNGPDWLVWWAAIARIGAMAVPLSTFSRSAELARVIRHADLHLLIAQSTHMGNDYVRTLEGAFESLAGSGPDLLMADAPFLRAIVLNDGEVPGWAHGAQWLTEIRIDEGVVVAAESEVHCEDPVMIVYTSGQSAEPKGVVHNHGGLVVKARYVAQMLGMEPDVQLHATMPFFWVGGLLMNLLAPLSAGVTVTCQDRAAQRGGIIGSSAAVANPFPNLQFAPALGMTETLGMYSWGSEWRVDGYPLASPLDLFQPGVEVRIDEGDTPGRGEILVRGVSVTRALVKVERSGVFDADGFYRTGDEGVVDGSRIHFVGRLGDMIKTSGASVSPAEVERELVALDGVATGYVTSLPDAIRGEEVVAAVTSDGAKLDPRRLREQLAQRLSAYKVPRRIAVLDESEVPLTPSMKVRRRELRILIDARTRDQR